MGPFSRTHQNSFSILARIQLFPGIHPDSAIFWYSHWLDPFPVLTRTGFGYWHGFYFFLVLTRILPFFCTRIDWTLFRYSPEQFFDNRRDSSFSRYSHGFESFSVLTLIAHFSGSHPNSSSILARIYFFLVLTQILPFFGTHIDWTLFRYSPEQFFDTRRDFCFSRYSHEFDHFSVLTLIGDFSGTHPNNFSILARILLFLGTHSDSSIFWYSNWLDPFPVLTRTVFWYS